jgi:hypothetical protein
MAILYDQEFYYMKVDEAAQVLGIAVNAIAEARQRAFKTQGSKLQSKLEHASTEGLKIKYREAIKRLEEAYETLELYADSSDLPSLRQDFADSQISTSPSETNSDVHADNVNPINVKKKLAIVAGVILAIMLVIWIYKNNQLPMPPIAAVAPPTTTTASTPASQPQLQNVAATPEPQPAPAQPQMIPAPAPQPNSCEKKELVGEWDCISPGTQYSGIFFQLDSFDELKEVSMLYLISIQ